MSWINKKLTGFGLPVVAVTRPERGTHSSGVVVFRNDSQLMQVDYDIVIYIKTKKDLIKHSVNYESNI